MTEVNCPFGIWHAFLYSINTDKNENILKAIKNATGTSVVFPVNISFIHYVLVLTSVPNVGERFTKTLAQLHTSAKKLAKNDKFIRFFGSHIKSENFI